MTTTDNIDYHLAAATQIELAQAIAWGHAVNKSYDFVEALIRTLYDVGPSKWEAADWILAQIAVETGNLTSDWAVKYNNFGGIGVNGATNLNTADKKPPVPKDGSNDWVWMIKDGKWQWVAGLTQPDPVEGALMMIGHRKAFTDPNFNDWARAHSPRYITARDNRIANHWPVADSITYFGGGKWAADPNYWPKIVTKFKEIRDWKSK